MYFKKCYFARCYVAKMRQKSKLYVVPSPVQDRTQEYSEQAICRTKSSTRQNSGVLRASNMPYQVQYKTELRSTPCLEWQRRRFHTHLVSQGRQVLDETIPSHNTYTAYSWHQTRNSFNSTDNRTYQVLYVCLRPQGAHSTFTSSP